MHFLIPIVVNQRQKTEGICIFLATDYVLSISVVSRKKLTNYSRMWGE